jgi:hypothetical protein
VILTTAPTAAPRFTLYSRSYCHLCEDMLAALQAMAPPGQAFDVDVIDIDAGGVDAALAARFDELVPVLFGADGQGAELCHYFLDPAAVAAYLRAAAG